MGTGGIFLRKLRAKVVEEPTGFVWVEKGKLAASGYPASRAQVQWLVNQGISSILTLTPAPLPAEFVEGFGLELGRVPMEDHKAPAQESLERAASFIQDEMGRGRVVLVHCLAGEGRTGCAIAAYMIKDRGLNPSDALRKIRTAKPAFVEHLQEGVVLAYKPA